MGEVVSPRVASLLFARGLQRVDRIQPAAIRAPIAAMLEAGIERCTVSTSLLGQPVNDLLDLAQALVGDIPPEVAPPIPVETPPNRTDAAWEQLLKLRDEARALEVDDAWPVQRLIEEIATKS